MSKPRPSSVPERKPSYGYIYNLFGITEALQAVSANAQQARKDIIHKRLLRKHKQQLRQRHQAKLQRNLGAMVTPCLLNGCLVSASASVASTFVLAALSTGIYTLFQNSSAITAAIRCERSYAALPQTKAVTDNTRLLDELVRERTPRFLPMRPVRAIGNAFDCLFSTRARYNGK